MSAELGYCVPEMINDGGISFTATHTTKIPPVFSMEVINFIS
jgi:hypothetical protein